MILRAAAIAVCLGVAGAAQAGTISEQLMKLDPEERAHQACALKGIDTVRHDKSLAGADRMKTSIFGPAEFKGGTQIHAGGGAVRANHHWYALHFDCTVTSDQMKATAFTYKLGKEIPKEDWDNLGLWQ